MLRRSHDNSCTWDERGAVVAELFDRAEGFIGPCVGVKPGWVGVWRRTRGVRVERLCGQPAQ
jgi:hypothetical protein